METTKPDQIEREQTVNRGQYLLISFSRFNVFDGESPFRVVTLSDINVLIAYSDRLNRLQSSKCDLNLISNFKY